MNPTRIKSRRWAIYLAYVLIGLYSVLIAGDFLLGVISICLLEIMFSFIRITRQLDELNENLNSLSQPLTEKQSSE